MDTLSPDAKLQNLISRLTKLNRANVPTGRAMHKPVMILALMDVLEHAVSDPGHIPIDAPLKKNFDAIWLMLVPDVKTGDFFKPVFHLPNEDFWGVFKANGHPATREYHSLAGAAKDGLWSSFNPEYLDLLKSAEVREIVRMVVLDTYFPQTKQTYWDTCGQAKLIAEKDNLIRVEELAPKYVSRLQFTHFEGFVRHWKFRAIVLYLYDSTCCISGLHAQKGLLHPLVDACHITQHARTGLDQPENGIALCKNLHAAFDAGLIAFSSDYRVLVTEASDFHEADSVYNLNHLRGQRIRLPQDNRYFPAEHHLAEHRDRWGFKE